jgi:hypothetical protein
MANIMTLLSTLLNPGPAKEPVPAEGPLDRIDYDLMGLSDTDAMWYYERRHWQGRD